MSCGERIPMPSVVALVTTLAPTSVAAAGIATVGLPSNAMVPEPAGVLSLIGRTPN
jgi:hypothetical protein